jgi:hypothetical protein
MPRDATRLIPAAPTQVAVLQKDCLGFIAAKNMIYNQSIDLD